MIKRSGLQSTLSAFIAPQIDRLILVDEPWDDPWKEDPGGDLANDSAEDYSLPDDFDEDEEGEIQ